MGFVDVNRSEWKLVAPIVSQTKGIDRALRSISKPDLLQRALMVGVEKDDVTRAIQGAESSESLIRLILRRRLEFPQPPPYWI